MWGNVGMGSERVKKLQERSEKGDGKVEQDGKTWKDWPGQGKSGTIQKLRRHR